MSIKKLICSLFVLQKRLPLLPIGAEFNSDRAIGSNGS